MTRFTTLLAVALTVATPAAHAQKLVIELFTSQSCSSCPPADALLSELATNPHLLALDMHVDYWNGIGWHDPFSLPQLTARQTTYATLLHQDSDFTPELVVGGELGVVGSDRGAVTTAIATAAAHLSAAPPTTLRLTRAPTGLALAIGPGQGPATLWLVGYDPRHVTQIRGGENGGRTLTESNVVRSLAPLATWSGQALALTAARPAGADTAAFLQAPDGRIIAATTLAF